MSATGDEDLQLLRGLGTAPPGAGNDLKVDEGEASEERKPRVGAVKVRR